MSTSVIRKNAANKSASVRFAEGTSTSAEAQAQPRHSKSADVAKRRLTSSDLALFNGEDGEAETAEGSDEAIANQAPNTHVKPIFDKFRLVLKNRH